MERAFLKAAEGLCICLGLVSPEMTNIRITHHLTEARRKAKHSPSRCVSENPIKDMAVYRIPRQNLI